MKKIYSIIIIVFCESTFCQVGIGTTTPNGALEINSTNNGLVIPRVALTSRLISLPVTNPNTGGAPLTSTLVYNTNTSGVSPNNVSPGFYYWNGAQWLPINTSNSRPWLASGNTGNIATDFIGTIDAQNIVFKRANIFSGIISTNNTAFGFNSFSNNISGNQNIAFGQFALNLLTNGQRNCAIGHGAAVNTLDGSDNVAVGNFALQANGIGSQNSGIGSQSLFNCTSGINNTGVGYNTQYRNGSGNNNTSVGSGALYNNTFESNSTAIGYNAFFNGSFNNSTAIGANSAITANNQVRIGNNTVTSIGGFVNWTNISDRKFKKNIKYNDVPGLDFILKLKPVTYNLDIIELNKYFSLPKEDTTNKDRIEKEQILQTGFIAQEVENAANQIGFNFSGVDKPKNKNDNYGLRYSEFVVPLTKAIQEQQELIKELQEEIKFLKRNLKYYK